MVGFDPVVRIPLGVMPGDRDKLVKDARVGRCPIRRHLNGHRPERERPAEERSCCGQIAPDGQPHVDDLPVLVDRPVQVRPQAVDLDVGLVNEPAVTRHVTARPCRFDELRCEPLDPPVDGDVIDVHSPLGEQLLNVPVGQSVSQVPPPRGNRKPANAEADEDVMTPVSCPVRWLNATVPWECLRGSPAYARIGGLRYPARRTLGSDIAGVVDDVGEGVTGFRPGDEVYGDNLALMGGFAEYALAPESALAHKPVQLTFAEASTIPQAGAIALQGTESSVAGGRVLINRAGGGSGSFAIQLAKRLGAHVTGVDNAAKQDFMRSVGADDVIDYRLHDFTRTTRPYDLVLDPVAHRSVFGLRNVRTSSR